MTGSEASPAKGLVVTTVRGDKRRCLGQRPRKRCHFFPRGEKRRGKKRGLFRHLDVASRCLQLCFLFFKKSEATCPRFSLCLNSNGFAVMERSTTLGSLLPSCSPLPPPPCLVLDRIPFIVIDREPNPRSTSSERKSENSDIFTFHRGGCSAPLPTSSEACFPRAKERAAAACYP